MAIEKEGKREGERKIESPASPESPVPKSQKLERRGKRGNETNPTCFSHSLPLPSVPLVPLSPSVLSFDNDAVSGSLGAMMCSSVVAHPYFCGSATGQPSMVHHEKTTCLARHSIYTKAISCNICAMEALPSHGQRRKRAYSKYEAHTGAALLEIARKGFRRN